MGKTILSRTVFIGLGGTGAKSIVKTKSLMLDNFGEIPPMIKFLAIDTDSITKINCKNKAGENITLDKDEFIHFQVPDINQYVKANPRETNFFQKELLKKKVSITEGAGQFRPCGRISLIANDNQSLRTQIVNTINRVKLWVGAQDDNYQVDTTAPTRVFVVFSLAGGTGAGLFIDFSLLLKGDMNIAAGTGIKTVAVGLLPDVYASLGVLAENCKPNAITGITEYEFIADGILQDIIPDSTHPARNVRTGGGRYPVDANNLYDTFFMVNNESSTGVKYESINEMENLISMSLYVAAGATGGTANSALDNMIALKAGQAEKGRMLRYLGLGCAEMV
ncbi:MAG: tubulin-like doman-containing protein, partial [bacterium]